MTFDKTKATLIGTVCGIAFHEHLKYGGDVGLIAVHAGEALQTDWYDLPTVDDIGDRPAGFMATYRD